MSYFKRFRALPLIFGGTITAVLALLLLPKPSTAPDPGSVDAGPTAVAPEPVPQIHTAPSPTAVPDAAPTPEVPVAPAPPARPTRDSVLPVSSRGFRDAMELRYEEMVACYDSWAVSYTHLTLPTTPYV